jgi:hypothetical protein
LIAEIALIPFLHRGGRPCVPLQFSHSIENCYIALLSTVALPAQGIGWISFYTTVLFASALLQKDGLIARLDPSEVLKAHYSQSQ